MQNILWFGGIKDLTEDSRTLAQIMDDLVTYKFTGLAYAQGAWKTDGAIAYTTGKDNQVLQGALIIAAAHARGLKVYGSLWAGTWNPEFCPELTSGSVRAKMASGLTDLISSINFDVFIDDIEDYQVSTSAHAEWAKLMGQTLHSLGKKSAVYYYLSEAAPIYKTFFPLISSEYTDFMVIHFYPNNAEWMFNTQVCYNGLLTYLPSSVKWMAQCRCQPRGSASDYSAPENMTDNISFYDSIYGSGFAANFEGFTVWYDWYLYGAELELWNNWELKNIDTTIISDKSGINILLGILVLLVVALVHMGGEQ